MSEAFAATLSGAGSRPPVWECHHCGRTLDAACGAPSGLRGCRIDAEHITARLEAAGATLLSMRGRSPWPAGAASAMPDIVRDAYECYGWTDEPVRPATPDAIQISRMDLAYQWLNLIDQRQFLIRRLVAVRSLVDPLTLRHVVSWQRLGRLVRADYRACQAWHAKGIVLICEKLRG